MLEIIILIAYCRHLSRVAKAKGRSGGGWAFLGIIAWLGAEVFAVAIYAGASGGGFDTTSAMSVAYLCAGTAAFLLSRLLKSLPDLNGDRSTELMYDSARPARVAEKPAVS